MSDLRTVANLVMTISSFCFTSGYMDVGTERVPADVAVNLRGNNNEVVNLRGVDNEKKPTCPVPQHGPSS